MSLIQQFKIALQKEFAKKRKPSPKATSGELFEDRVLLSAVSTNTPPQEFGPTTPVQTEFYSIDGTGNNLANPDQGSTDEQLLRIVSVAYTDGIASPAGEGLPSARAISNAVVAQTESIENDRYLSDYIWIWGQFIDHDLDLTEAVDPAEEFNIEVPKGDIYFDPTSTGEVTIHLNRSYYDPETGITNPRQQLNQLTAYLDGSVVYGSDAERAAALRTFEGGHLATSDGNLLPFNSAGLENAGGTSDALFLAGDVRANENAALSSIHSLFVREHNRIADELAVKDPSLSDEAIYRRARSIVTAQIQAITFSEFLPALLGENAISNYQGYNEKVDPSISNLFSTAAYRLGHSFLSSELQLVDADGSIEELALQNAFFRPDVLIGNGIDSILRGAATQTAQELDSQIIDDVRNFLFGPPGSGGFDLASLNIQRGRDHGLPSYNQARIDLGLAAATSFADISSDPDVQARLASVYDSVNEVDVWVGGLAEDHVEGASVGELLQTVLVDQFERIRNGDRLWYQNNFSGEELRQLDNTTLADVIERNTKIENLQENVFFVEGRETALNDEVLLFNSESGRFTIGVSNGKRFEEIAGPRWANDVGFQMFDGDFNGDGRQDIAGLNENGDWYAALSDGETLQTQHFGRWNANAGWTDIRVGDFNGDGNDDVVGRTATGQLWIGQSNGEVFQNLYGGRVNATGWEDVVVGDFDGNGTDDLASRHVTGQWWIGYGTDGRFDIKYAGQWSGTANWQDVVVGDFDGDQQDDIAGRTAAGAIWIAHIDNGRIRNEFAGNWRANGWENVLVGDVDGDQLDDLIGLNDRGEIYVNLANPNGGRRVTDFIDRWDPNHTYVATVGDFNHDGRDDIAGLDENGHWVMTSLVTDQGQPQNTRPFGATVPGNNGPGLFVFTRRFGVMQQLDGNDLLTAGNFL